MNFCKITIEIFSMKFIDLFKSLIEIFSLKFIDFQSLNPTSWKLIWLLVHFFSREKLFTIKVIFWNILFFRWSLKFLNSTLFSKIDWILESIFKHFCRKCYLFLKSSEMSFTCKTWLAIQLFQQKIDNFWKIYSTVRLRSNKWKLINFWNIFKWVFLMMIDWLCKFWKNVSTKFSQFVCLSKSIYSLAYYFKFFY